MKRALLAFLALVLLAVGAAAVILRSEPPALTGDPIYRQGTFSLRLTQHACEDEEINADLSDRGIPPVLEYWTLQRDGRWSVTGCYAPDMDGDILTRDTVGGEGFMPRKWFDPVPGA